MASAQILTIREPPGLVRSDLKRPDGLTLFPWSNGRSLCWDFTCSDTMAPSHISVTSKKAANSARQAEKRKMKHYEEIATSHIVMPIAVETMGCWIETGLAFMKDLGGRIEEHTGEKRSTSYLFQSVGIAIQRGNAASVTGTATNSRALNELFYL